MNPELETSTSSQPSSQYMRLVFEDCKNLREQVKSTNNATTLISYSRLICVAFESIEAMIHKFNSMYPYWEADEIKAWEYCVDKACEIGKEARRNFMNSILTSSSGSNTGGSRKVMIWKRQCDKNIEKIESLVNAACMRDQSTWSMAFVSHTIVHGVYSILAVLYRLLKLKDSLNVGNLKLINAEMLFGKAEKDYKRLLLELVDVMPEVLKRQRKDLNKKDLVEEEEENDAALKEEEELRERYQEEIVAMFQNNLQEDETQIKNSVEGEINKKELHEDEAVKKIQQEEEGLKNLHKEDTQKKSQNEETSKNLQEEEATKKLQEDDNQKNSQNTEVDKRIQEEKALMKSEEKNSGDKTVEFTFCGITVRMKNGEIDQVLDC